jgi:hypothetical protein
VNKSEWESLSAMCPWRFESCWGKTGSICKGSGEECQHTGCALAHAIRVMRERMDQERCRCDNIPH